MKKTLLAVLFCLCLIILLPVASAGAETFDLYVGGVQVTSDNKDSITGEGIALGADGYVRYDPTTSTLSLKDVTVTGVADAATEGYAFGVRAFGALNIETSGTVTLRGSDASTGAYGIFTSKSLCITNSGDFSALGFDNTNKEVYSYGIRCGSTLSIVNNGTLKADGLKGPKTSFGIRADGDITFDGTGTANVLGRYAVRIVDSDKNITINSGTIIATVTYPKNTSIRLRNTEYGIQCDVLTVAKDASLKVNYSGEDVFYDKKQESYRIDDSQSYAISCNTLIVEGKVEAENPKLAISGDLVHTPGIAYQIWRSLGAVNAKYDTSYGTAYYVLIDAETGNGVRGSYAVSTADPERFVYTIEPVAGSKYSMDGGAWQESNVFDLIEPQSTHSFLVAAIDDSSFESTGNITFNKLPNDNVPSLRYAVSGSNDDRTLTITPVEGAEYSFNGGATWGADNTQANIGVETLTIAIRYTETAVQYASVSVSAEVDLTDTAPSISFDESEVDKVYGDSDFVVEAIVANIDGSLTYTTSDANIAQVDNAGRVHIIGAGTVTVTAAFSDAESGREASAQYTLNIAPAALTVKADDKTMFAGSEKPVFTATATGLVNGDTITGITYMDDADTTRNGSYSITPHGGSISSGNDNYLISYAAGTLTVTVDVSGIEAAVEAANTAMAGVSVHDGSVEDIPNGTSFVSTETMTTLSNAIAAAEAAKDTVNTADELQAAINALNQAIAEFTASIQTGTMIVYTVDASASPASGGTVTGGGSHRAGENVIVEAAANSGYRFVRWTENGASISTSPSYTIPNISASRTLVAEFEVDTSASLGYIAFESAKSFTLYVNTKLWNGRLMYSTDGASWSEWDGSELTAGTIGADYAIYLRGYGNNNISGFSSNGRFVLTGSSIACRGNIENLLDCEAVAAGNHPVMAPNCFAHLFSGCTALMSAPTLPATTLAGSCYAYMFSDCTSLMAAPALPAKALGANCYTYMFSNCSSLTAAPELTATTLAKDCYRYMFNGCTALTTAPALPATVLEEYCYISMFNGCTAMTAAPALPAKELKTACYRGMFEGCTALTAVPVLSATVLANNCYESMFEGCTALTTAPALPATTLANNCYASMFMGCTALAAAPALPATTLAASCYLTMFSGCTGIAISETQTEEYSTPWRIPTEGTAAGVTYWNRSMLSNTGGTFKSNPDVNTTYYQKGKAPKTAVPVFAPDGGAFTGSVNVTITCATDGADIYYTTDDTEPTASSSKYENAITLTESATIKAIAVKNGMTGSDIASAIFTKSEPVLGGTAAINGAAKYGETLSVDTSGITGNEGTFQYEWMSGGNTVGNQAEYTLASSDIGKIISCEVTDTISTGSVTATLDSVVAKADGPAAPTGLSGVAPTVYGGNGKITGTTATMEYSTDTAFTVAASCTDDETVVPAGTYYVRYKERETQKASAYTEVAVPAYTPNTLGGTAAINGAAKYGETLSVDISGITGNEGTFQYKWMSGGSSVGDQPEYTLAASDIGKIISCEVTDTISTGSVTATLDSVVAKADGPAAPTGLSGVAPTVYGGNGKITGTTAAMEYSADAAFTAAASCADTETDVPAGVYYVRIAETSTNLAGAYVQVTVPNAVPTVTGIEVNSIVHKTEYIVNDTLDVTGLTILVTKSDSSTETVSVTAAMVSGFDSSNPSESQVLTITHEGQTTTYTVNIKAPVTLYTLTVVGGTAEGSGEYISGAVVNIQANAPAEGKQFKNWTATGGGSFGNANSASTTYTMPAGNATITANYEDIPVATYTVTVSADPSEGGSVTGGGSYNAGENVTVTATPNSGYHFVKWTEHGVEAGSTESLTISNIDDNYTLVAVFEADIRYTITDGAHQSVVKGNEAVFVSNAEFVKFVEVWVDGNSVDTTNYSAVSGSTKITLKSAYIKALTIGKHSLEIISTDGKAETYFMVEAPENQINIIRHPDDQFVAEGQKATFSIGVSGGTLPYAYQWFINRNDGAGWNKIDGATSASYTTSVTKLSNNGYKYYCSVSDADGQKLDSNKATLFVSKYVEPPKTGDDSMPLLWLGLVLAGIAGIVALTWHNRKKAC